jgi:predicted DNA-binding transcriptional regulator AlpA
MLKAQRPQPEGTGGAVGDSAQDHSTAPVEPPTTAGLLAELVKTLPLLQRALELQARPRVEPLAYRLDQLAEALGLSPRLIQKLVAARQFPAPVKAGRISVWPAAVVREFLAQQADGGRRVRQ